jgi:rubrerythrin
VLTGLDIENKSYDLYRSQAESVKDPVALKLYEFLAGQERTHFDLLMANYEAMVQFGGWTD